METIISVAQIAAAAILIILILLQERSAGLSAAFGGDSSFYQTRRGLERLIFAATVVFAFIFGGLSIINLVI